MKREILFRGKKKGNIAIKNGEWVFGVPFYTDGVIDGIECKNGHLYKIDLNTLGQYTGITDKNGKKIFEGDIVYIKFQEPTSKVTGEKPIYTIIFEKGCFSLFRKTNWIVVFDLRVWYKECEVIGNIFDKESDNGNYKA